MRSGRRNKVLCLPPDFTRFHSRAGELTRYAWQYYGERLTDVLPALGTHFPMTGDEIGHMFGDMPRTSSACTTGATASSPSAKCPPAS